MNKLRVLDFFAGIGAFDSALDRLGVDYELVDAVEIDKHAMASFNAVHGTNFECQDITKWDKDVGEIDIMWQSSPCQDISTAGRQAGADKDSGSRSSLVWEVIRIVEKVRPAVAIWENVKGLTTKRHKHILDEYIYELEQLGYTSKWEVLNSKDFLIPQNRSRCYTVSIRSDLDIDYVFPVASPLKRRLKDILEKDVDEKYYLPEERLAKIKRWDTRQRENGRGFRFDVKNGNDVARTVTTSSDRPAEITYAKDELKQVAQIYGFGKEPNPQAGRVYDKEGVSPTLDSCSGGNRMPKIMDDLYAGREPRVYDESAPTLRSGRQGLKVIESQPIKRRRSELGKELRKAYENHEIPANENMRESYIADDGVMPTITCSKREQRIAELFTVAVRGRSDGEWDESEHYQKAEPRIDGVTNTITGVQKDNYVAEPQIIDPQGRLEKVNKPKDLAPTLRAESHGKEPCIIEHNKSPKHQQDLVQDSEGLCRTIPAGTHGSTPHLLKTQVSPYRVRRLTAKECWRLQGFTDEEFEKAEKVASSTQLYRQAGNSCTVPVLSAIISQLGIPNIPRWNKLTIADREAISSGRHQINLRRGIRR